MPLADDDKLIYTFVPEMIRYYFEEPLINNVKTYVCARYDLNFVLENLDKLVVKSVSLWHADWSIFF